MKWIQEFIELETKQLKVKKIEMLVHMNTYRTCKIPLQTFFCKKKKKE